MNKASRGRPSWNLATTAALALAVSLAGAATARNATSGAATSPPAVAAMADTVTVAIQFFAFNPSVITVPAGTTVRWVNRDLIQHDVFGVSGASFLRAPILGQGQ